MHPRCRPARYVVHAGQDDERREHRVPTSPQIRRRGAQRRDDRFRYRLAIHWHHPAQMKSAPCGALRQPLYLSAHSLSSSSAIIRLATSSDELLSLAISSLNTCVPSGMLSHRCCTKLWWSIPTPNPPAWYTGETSLPAANLTSPNAVLPSADRRTSA